MAEEEGVIDVSAHATQRDRPDVGVRRPALVRALRLALTVLLVLVGLQPVLAGLFMDGHEVWRRWHGLNANAVFLAALVVTVLAVLVWRPGRGPGWVALAGAGLLVAVFLQVGVGMAGLASVHEPLGVVLVGMTATLLGRTRTLPRPGR